ncbi:MAG: hypothetical protein IT380_30645 [Myxococcales bacterium]|nr:hypothetical protein [Myxococcales bacterium]
MTERSTSGVWRVFTPSAAAAPPQPRASSPSGANSSSPSGLRRQLPAEPHGKAEMLLKLAAEECEKGAWAAAETNLRLALTFAPDDLIVQRRLHEVVQTREAQRKVEQARAALRR